jgi:hypothetical protein
MQRPGSEELAAEGFFRRAAAVAVSGGGLGAGGSSGEAVPEACKAPSIMTRIRHKRRFGVRGPAATALLRCAGRAAPVRPSGPERPVPR